MELVTELEIFRLDGDLVIMLTAAGLPRPAQEHPFAPVTEPGGKPRRWRFDFAWPAQKIAVEIEGLGQAGRALGYGRHQRPRGFAGDCEKYNWAARLGWRVFRFTPAAIKSGRAARFLEEVWSLTIGRAPRGRGRRGSGLTPGGQPE